MTNLDDSTDLQPHEIELLEDGRRQELAYFRRVDATESERARRGQQPAEIGQTGRSSLKPDDTSADEGTPVVFVADLAALTSNSLARVRELMQRDYVSKSFQHRLPEGRYELRVAVRHYPSGPHCR